MMNRKRCTIKKAGYALLIFFKLIAIKVSPATRLDLLMVTYEVMLTYGQFYRLVPSMNQVGDEVSASGTQTLPSLVFIGSVVAALWEGEIYSYCDFRDRITSKHMNQFLHMMASKMRSGVSAFWGLQRQFFKGRFTRKHPKVPRKTRQ